MTENFVNIKYQGNRYINDEAASRKVQLCLRATIPLSVKRDDLNLRGAPVTFTIAQDRKSSNSKNKNSNSNDDDDDDGENDNG